MKERASVGKTAIAVFVLVFVGFLIYQISGNLDEKITTMDAMQVTIEEKVSAEAVFIRDGTPIYGKNGSPEYLVENGEKVSAGQSICIFFNDQSTENTYAEMQSLIQKTEALKYTDSMVTNGTDGAKLDGLIYEQLSDINDELSEGKLLQTGKKYVTLAQLLDARDSGLYDQTGAREKISELEAQTAEYKKIIERSSNTVKAETPGYFIRSADGYDASFSVSCIENLTAEYIEQSRSAPQSTDGSIGTLVDGFYWYMAAVFNKEQTAVLSRMKDKGLSVPVYLPDLRLSTESFSVYAIKRAEDGSSVVVFKCPVMSADYLSSRFAKIELVLNEYTGVKIPREALHQKDGEWGVYCLEGTSEKFKPTKILYQTESYFLLEMADSTKNGLYLYDKIILGGVGIEK